MALRINLWSLPRCASTSTMYAFAQRADCRVFDEPLYAAYLHAHPEQQRPYREELIRQDETDPDRVVEDIIMAPPEPDRPVRLFKHIASQLLPNMRRDFLRETEHMLLLRHPFRVVASYYRTHGSVTVHDTGLPRMVELLRELEALEAGARPVLVVDNSAMLNEPERALREVCAHVGLEFAPEMLSWSKGGIPEDGLWAAYWYKGTHAGTGFAPEPPLQRAEDQDRVLEGLPPDVQHEARLCLPLYEEVWAKRTVKGPAVESESTASG